ncbi:MAG TPA: hypothetical protein VJ777_10290 [Mycobacterium sp.]|nr:hypothetical protein [Mycobacterium sp.]
MTQPGTGSIRVFSSSIKISQAHHGAADARRSGYESTFVMRGLSELHIDFKQVV